MNETYVYTPYILPMLASALLPAALALYAWRHRTVPGASSFVALEFFSALLALCAAIQMAAVTESSKILWFRIEAIAITGIGTAVIFFALDYTNLGKGLPQRTILSLLILPLVDIGLMVTNDFHHLYWSRLWFDGFVRLDRGPFGNLLVAGLSAYSILSVLIFLWLSIRSTGPYRVQAILLFVATLLPFLTFFLEPAGINPFAPLDPLVLILNINGLICVLAIYRFGMLSIIPIGRDTAIERMADGVMILNIENRIVDFNPAARQVLALSQGVVGQLARPALVNYPDLLRLIDDENSGDTEATIERANLSRAYQVHVSTLVDSRGLKLGRLLLFYDITLQKQAQAQLVAQQRVMATLEERERLARELHDGLGQMLAAAHLQASTAKRLLAQSAYDQSNECLEFLTAMTLEMESDVREHLLGAKTVLSDDQRFFIVLRQYLTRFSQQYDLRIDVSVPPELEAQGFVQTIELHLFRVIQEALSNIRKHARAQCASVNFSIADSLAQIVIADDGVGFDPAAQSNRFGQQAMRERAEAMGGTLQVISSVGKGTQVVVQVPLMMNEEMKP